MVVEQNIAFFSSFLNQDEIAGRNMDNKAITGDTAINTNSKSELLAFQPHPRIPGDYYPS